MLVTALIFILAAQSGASSSVQSSRLLGLIEAFLKLFNLHLDQKAVDLLHNLLRKLLGHFGLFMLEGILAYWTVKRFINLKTKYLVVRTLIGGLIIASISEIIQIIAPNRGPSILDVLIDFLGYGSGVFLTLLVINIKIKKTKHQA